MSTFASTKKESLIWMLSNEANRIAESSGIEKGKIAFCLRPVVNDVCAWMYDKETFDYVSVHDISKPMADEDEKTIAETGEQTKEPIEFGTLGMITDDALIHAVNEAIGLRKIKLYDDQYLTCHDFGSSFCFPIYDNNNEVVLYLVVIVDCATSGPERNICFKLHDAVDKWCKENGKWTPKSSPRPAGLIAG